jgi:uncharacterized Fe-S radical SAM superfamily protein PflX
MNHNRPSVYRQNADIVSRATTTGMMASQLARVSAITVRNYLRPVAFVPLTLAKRALMNLSCC